MTSLRFRSSLLFCALAAAGARTLGACGSDALDLASGDDAGADVFAQDASFDAPVGDTGADAGDLGDGDGGGGGGDAAADGAFVADGGSADDAGPGGSASSLPCGSAQCRIPAETCCVSSNPNPPPDFFYGCYSGACPLDAGAGAGASAGAVTSLKCSGAANCAAGTVCCVYENANKQVVSDCLASCGAGQAQLCDPGAAISGCSAASGACSSANVTDWGLPATYATCGGVGN